MINQNFSKKISFFSHYFEMYKSFYKDLGRRLNVTILLAMTIALFDSAAILIITSFVINFKIGDDFVDLEKVFNFLPDKAEALLYISNWKLPFEIFGLLLFCSIALKAIFSYWSLRYIAKSRAFLLAKLKKQCHDYFIEQSKTNYNMVSSSNFVNFLSEQTNRAAQSFQNFSQLSSQISFTIVYIIFAVSISVTASFLLTCLVLLVGLIFQRLRSYIQVSSQRVISDSEALNGIALELANNIEYLQAVKKPYLLRASAYTKINNVVGSYQHLFNLAALSHAIKEPVVVGFILLSLISLSFFTSEMGAAILSVILLYRASSNILNINSSFLSTLEFYQSFKECKLGWQTSLGDTNRSAVGAAVEKKTVGCGIIIKNLSVRASTTSIDDTETPYVLQNVNMTIPTGSITAVVGPSGSGKSSLLRVISGVLRPSNGSVEYQLGSNKVNQSYPSVGYVPQVPKLFNASFYFNVALEPFEHSSLSDRERVIRLCESLELGSVLSRNDHDLSVQCGNGLYTLSGGEIQRVVIARELFRKPDILLLDEPTSALDRLSLRSSWSAILEQATESNIIIATHDLDLLTSVDRIVALKQGRLEYFGNGNEFSGIKVN